MVQSNYYQDVAGVNGTEVASGHVPLGLSDRRPGGRLQHYLDAMSEYRSTMRMERWGLEGALPKITALKRLASAIDLDCDAGTVN